MSTADVGLIEDPFVATEPDDQLRPTLSDRWRDVLISGAMLGAGWLLFEWTHRPGLAAVVAAGKFGWSDFLTAFWLRKRDPDKGRGIACFWFYFAAGLWKVTVVAFLLAAIVAFVAGRERGRPAKRVVRTGLSLTGTSLCLLSVAAVVGAISARKYRVRVWVDGSMHGYRKRNLWPVWPTGKNNVRGLLLSSLILPMVFTAYAMRFRISTQLILLLMAEALVISLLIRGAVARTPQECWASAWDENYDVKPDVEVEAVKEETFHPGTYLPRLEQHA